MTWIYDQSSSIRVETLTVFIIILFIVISVVTIPILCSSWYRATISMKVINKEFNTNYSVEDIFWSENIIRDIQDLKQRKLEIQLKK